MELCPLSNHRVIEKCVKKSKKVKDFGIFQYSNFFSIVNKSQNHNTGANFVGKNGTFTIGLTWTTVWLTFPSC